MLSLSYVLAFYQPIVSLSCQRGEDRIEMIFGMWYFLRD